MKFLIDCHVFDGMYQGTRTYLEGLYSSFLKQNEKDIFYFAAVDIDNLQKIFGHCDNVKYLKYSSHNKYVRLVFLIPALIKKYKIDYAHFQYFVPMFKKCREIVTIHDVLFLDYKHLFPYFYRLRNKILFKKAAKRADILLTVSEYSKERISKHFNIKQDCIHVIPNGITFNPDENESDIKKKYSVDHYLLYVSRIEPRKNHIDFIKAYINGSYYNKYKLVFIGQKDFKSEIVTEYIESLPEEIKLRILLLSNIPSNELSVFYRQSSLFVFPSKAEGFGIPPLEALLYGTSVICADNSAMRDFTFLGDRLFDESDIDAFTKKIGKYVDNKVDIEEMKEYVKSHFNWDVIARQYKDLVIKD